MASKNGKASCYDVLTMATFAKRETARTQKFNAQKRACRISLQKTLTKGD